ncbi:MAG: TonB-dependent receptor, partial [Acidobacteriia bacterium]|nr:TonB-dependent receptor [Terriglobia bacterium]
GNPLGTYGFTNAWTGQAYADFLLGLLTSDSRQLGVVPNYMRQSNFSVFAQDDWKITHRLTLNLGLRYELPGTLTDKYGRTSAFVPGPNVLAIGSEAALAASGGATSNPNLLVAASQLGLPPAGYPGHNDFAPRLGFAWRPFGGNRTVVRGGYGIFFAATPQNTLRLSYGGHFPFALSQAFNRITTNANYLTFANPFPTPPSNTANLATLALFAIDEYAKTPNLQSWNLTVERELGRSSAIEISYAGSKGTHLPIYENINQPYWPPRTPAGDYPGFGTINYYPFSTNSLHNAGTVTFRRRLKRDFFYTANYVYSKTIDEGSEIAGGSFGGIATPQNIHCIRCDRGRADFDINHAFTTTFSWISPFHQFVLRGWQIAGSGRFYSGLPFTPSLANTTLGQPNRPDRLRTGTLPDPSVTQWFDITAFVPVPPNSYRFGNSGRSILDGPGREELNLNFSKNFAVTEWSNLQFRWEIFNVLNHPNFGLPIKNIDVLNAATLTSAGSPRLMQFALRYSF